MRGFMRRASDESVVAEGYGFSPTPKAYQAKIRDVGRNAYINEEELGG